MPDLGRAWKKAMIVVLKSNSETSADI